MADFPSLSVNPCHPYGIEFSEAGDLKSPTEAGYKITRKRFTRTPKVRSCAYKGMTDADKELMVPFIELHKTTGNFNWTDIDSTVLDVRFAELPKIIKAGLRWNMDCKFEEV